MIDTHLHVSKNPQKLLMSRVGVCVIKSSQFRAFYRSVRCQLRCWVSNLFLWRRDIFWMLEFSAPLCGVWARLSLVAFWSEWIQCLLITTAPKSFQPEPCRVSWGGIKNQSKSTWCQSALIQFSINKTFQTALKMAHRKFMYLLNVTERKIIWQLFIWWQQWKKFL